MPGEVRSPQVTAVGPATAAALAWRREGRLRVTVIVKAAFALVPGAAMAPVEPEEIVRAEVHRNNNPMRSVQLTSDLAPYLPRADVLLVGHAWAPQGKPVEEMSVRLALFRDRPLISKVIRVRGDEGGGRRAPFEQMPLIYERAFGGIGWEENPHGVGAEVDDARSPNLVHPEDPRRVACFAPVSRTWPARKRRLGGADRRALDAAIAEIPPDFDWGYFNAAPPDQQVEHLQGNEWLLLDGLHPAHVQLQSFLPYARGLARVRATGAGAPEGEPVTLVGDTLRVDADRLRCSVVWRGSFPVADERALAGLQIEAGVETYGQPLVWPAQAPGGRGGRAQEATVALDVGPLKAELAAAPEGFEDVTDLAMTLPPEGSARAGDADRGTLSLNDEEQQQAATRPAAPFHADEAGLPLPPAPPPPPPDFAGQTLSLGDEAPDRARPVSAPPAPPALDLPEPHAPAAAAAPRNARKQRPVSAQGIALVNDTPLALAAIPWDMRPSRGCLTVIAKASCDLVPGGPAALRPQAEPLEADRHAGDPARTGCVHPSDVALYKVRADVVLTGHAWAPAGGARVMEVRFRFGEEERGFDRRVLVFGERAWTRGVAGPKPGEPQPFQRVPLRHEHAFGGPGFAPNPVGVGRFDPARPAGRPAPLPQLESPDARLRTPRQAALPACFAPVPLAWKERGPRPRRAGVPWPFLPEDIDWTFFQAAPPEQQLAFLRGDEPFAIQGAHRQHTLLAGSLPGVRARCFAAWQEGRFTEVPLRLDTAAFDVDALKLTLVWRGAVPVPDERAPGIAALHLLAEDAGVEGMTLAEARARTLRS